MDRLSRGRQIRTDVMGKDIIDSVFDAAGDIERDQQELYTAYAWCDVFEREGLPKPTRLLINIAVLAMLGERETLKHHVRAAARLGCTQVEIREAIIQAGTLAGGVRAIHACRAADQALREGPGQPGAKVK